MKMNTIESPLSRFQLPKLAAVALGGLLLVGCAGNPPNEQFAVTESAVRSAVSAGATQYAPVDMRAAQENLDLVGWHSARDHLGLQRVAHGQQPIRRLRRFPRMRAELGNHLAPLLAGAAGRQPAAHGAGGEDLLGAALDALGAVEAHRGLVHAVGADGPIAALADDAGPPIGIGHDGHVLRQLERRGQNVALPDAEETTSWDARSFKVNGKAIAAEVSDAGGQLRTEDIAGNPLADFGPVSVANGVPDPGAAATPGRSVPLLASISREHSARQ